MYTAPAAFYVRVPPGNHLEKIESTPKKDKNFKLVVSHILPIFLLTYKIL